MSLIETGAGRKSDELVIATDNLILVVRPSLRQARGHSQAGTSRLRTCAKLCRAAGGDLEQMQLLLGHASIRTTEQYLGKMQALMEAVNDRLGLEL